MLEYSSKSMNLSTNDQEGNASTTTSTTGTTSNTNQQKSSSSSVVISSSHDHHHHSGHYSNNEGIAILTEYNPMTSSFHLEPIDTKHPERTIAKPMLDVMGEELARSFDDENITPQTPEGSTSSHHHHEKLPVDGLQRQPLYKTIGYSLYYIGSGSTSSFVLGLLLPKLVVQMLGRDNKELYLSIVVSIATVIGVIVSPIVGNISDRIGRQTRIPIVVVATLVWSLMIVLQSICSMMHTQFPQYYVFIFVIYGIVLCIGKCGYVTSQAIVTAMVTDLFPQEQINLVSALVGIFTLLGVMLGVVLGGVIIGHVDLIWVCLGYATLCSLVCVPLMLFHRELKKPRIKQIEKEAAKKPGELENVPLTTPESVITTQEPPKPPFYKRALNFALTFMVPFKNRNFTWVFITRFTIQLTNAAARNYFFYFIQEVLTPYNFILTNKFPTNNEEALSLFLGIVFLFTFVSALFAQKLAGLIGRRYVYSAGALGCGIASIILIIFRSYSVMILCCSILYGLGIGSFISVDLSLVNSVLTSKDDSGKDLALWNISGTVPELLGVPLGGLIILVGEAIAPDYSGMGYLLLYALGAALQILSAFMVFCVRLSRAQDTGKAQKPQVQSPTADPSHNHAEPLPSFEKNHETPLEEYNRNEIELKEFVHHEEELQQQHD